jgi:hypothetical protein
MEVAVCRSFQLLPVFSISFVLILVDYISNDHKLQKKKTGINTYRMSIVHTYPYGQYVNIGV